MEIVDLIYNPEVRATFSFLSDTWGSGGSKGGSKGLTCQVHTATWTVRTTVLCPQSLNSWSTYGAVALCETVLSVFKHQSSPQPWRSVWLFLVCRGKYEVDIIKHFAQSHPAAKMESSDPQS